MPDPVRPSSDEGAEEREAQLAKFRGVAPGLSGRLAGERADAIPEAAVTRAVRAADEAFESEGGSSRHWVRDCFLPALEAEGLTLRAAHPEAGSEEGERLRALLTECKQSVGPSMRLRIDKALRAAHPEADRAPSQQERDRALNDYMAEHGPNAQRRRRDAERREADRVPEEER